MANSKAKPDTASIVEEEKTTVETDKPVETKPETKAEKVEKAEKPAKERLSVMMQKLSLNVKLMQVNHLFCLQEQ